jgi:hypothetical protein
MPVLYVLSGTKFAGHSIAAPSGFMLQHGETSLQVHASGTGAVDLTVITLGPPVN